MRLPGLVVWKCHLHFHQIVSTRVNRLTKEVESKSKVFWMETKRTSNQQTTSKAIRRKRRWWEHTAGEKQPSTRDVTAELQSNISLNPTTGCLTISVFITSTSQNSSPKLTFLPLSLPIKTAHDGFKSHLFFYLPVASFCFNLRCLWTMLEFLCLCSQKVLWILKCTSLEAL